MVEFRRSGDSILVRFEADEAEVLRELGREMRTLLEADVPRSDPVIERIFPDASDNEEEAEAYRDLVGEELRNAKLAALASMDRHLDGASDSTTIPNEEVESWLTVVADMRLAVGTRLDVTEETMAAPIDADDPEGPALAVLHWLGYLQESLLRAAVQEQGQEDREE